LLLVQKSTLLHHKLSSWKQLENRLLSNHASPVPFLNKAFKGTNVYDDNDMPKIDYLIITHDHWDHLDYPTILKLKSKVGRVICGLGVGQHFEYWGFEASRILELDWQDTEVLKKGVEITATPSRHFSGRGFKRNKTLWASYALKINDYKLYIGGDGGFDTFYAEIGGKHGPFHLAILEQGQYSED